MNFEASSNMGKSVIPLQFSDPESSIRLTETKSIIDRFFFDLCGLQTIKSGDKDVLVRITKPIFTYEFAKDLSTRLYIEVNRITARTTFENKRLKNYLNLQSLSMADWFAIIGMHKLVSETAWMHINKLAELDPDSARKNEDGDVVLDNYWYSKYLIEWNFNQPVSDEMLEIVKKEQDLKGERFGQDSIMRNIFWNIRIFIEGGLNRSLDALTLDHEKMIHKESVIVTPSSAKSNNEGFVEKTRKNLMGLFEVNR